MGEKRFPPSRKKLLKAKREGRVARSALLTQALVFFCLFFGAWHLGGKVWVANRMLLEYVITEGYQAPVASLNAMLSMYAKLVGGILLFAAVVSVFAEFCQVGLRAEPSLAAPKFSRINPFSGAARMVSGIRQNALKILFALALSVVFGCVLNGSLRRTSVLFFASEQGKLAAWQSGLRTAAMLIGTVLLICGVIEYLLQRRRLYNELSMTLEELREEHRESEGDPHVKAARRAEHDQILRREIAKRVRRAKVIVVEES